jgi:hypothetical protein
MLTNAASHNERLFPGLQECLSDGTREVYVTAAEKLTRWMSRSQAYYPRARAQVSSVSASESVVC